MEQLVAQLAEAMAAQKQRAYNPDMMAQAGGNPNLPMNTSSQEPYAADQMRQQAIADQIAAQISNLLASQAGQRGAQRLPVGMP